MDTRDPVSLPARLRDWFGRETKGPITALNCDQPDALLEFVQTLFDVKRPSWISPSMATVRREWLEMKQSATAPCA